MVDDVFLKRVAHFVYEVYVYVGIVGIYLAATLVYGHEYRFDTACGLCHERCCARRSYGETRNVATSVSHYVAVELRVGILYAQQEGIVLLAFGVEYGERSALFSHLYR